jgi:tetratricopeptide (TPR) repeat protein
MSKADKYKAFASQLIRNPDDPEALVNQFAVVSEHKGNDRHYLPIARRAYELSQEIGPLFNYGSALHRVGEFEKALEVYKRCEKIAPDDWAAKVQHHLGVAYRALGEDRKAAEHYLKANEIEPNPNILKDRALGLLAQGKLLEGLKAFEVRREAAVWKLHQAGGHLISQAKLPDGVVHWEGQDLTGKSVVVYHEEGSGISFSSAGSSRS